jgi:toxin CcdB
VRQFDLAANPSESSRSHVPYFVVLQSHYSRALDTIVVAPVVRDALKPAGLFDLPVEVDGEALIPSIAELFAIESGLLRKVHGSVLDHEDAIRRALDRLFTGF